MTDSHFFFFPTVCHHRHHHRSSPSSCPSFFVFTFLAFFSFFPLRTDCTHTGIITLNQISSSKKKMKPVAKSPGTEENWAVNRAGSSLVTNRQSTLFRARSSTYLHNESVSSAAHGRHASMTSNLSPINTYRGVDNAQSMVSECDSRARTPLVVSDRAETPKAEAGRRGGREARASRRNGPA
uniref:Uncharacterized protein n=1 Tax=Lotharella globosa TaxID=91324 RepID=A0A7S3Z0K7_9EUKA|mmetsp:Transcript_12090/g.24312  ORF Transcript_12090/g.24312 Transcript_12090/m.24312 type:complete len:182 (+) Transcript_12090:170-715(+)